MLRIGTGTARGRRLKTVTGAMRPTGGRVRGSLFDILSARVVDGRVIDLCAGSGSLGIEALSRGARCCLFVDNDRRAVRMIRDNLASCGFGYPPDPPGQHDGRRPAEGIRSNALGRVWMADVAQSLGHLADHACVVDIILADPPYGDPVAQQIVRIVGERSVLDPGGVLVLEHHGDDQVEPCPGLELARRRSIGGTALSFFQPARTDQHVPAETVIRSETLPTDLPPPSSRTRR